MMFLFTPLPKANTGTADYAFSLLADLKRTFGQTIQERITIVVDHADPAEQFVLTVAAGWHVVDVGSVVCSDSDQCVYFLACNRHHAFCYEALARHRLGECISVIHDLTAAAYINNLSRVPGSAYASLMDQVFRGQAGDDFDHVHRTTQHFISGQGVTLAKSSHVVVHSHYARAKLVLDGGLGAAAERSIRVCRQPVPVAIETIEATAQAPSATDEFTIGSFGYFSRNKRFPSLVRAWSIFVERTPGLGQARLLLGGNVPAEARKTLLSSCRGDAGDRIAFAGFLGNAALNAAIERVNLLVVLRFPSGGESSGIVAHALRYQTPLALSAFAAFHEEPAAFRISVSPGEEIEQLAAAMAASFEAWRSGARLENREAEGFGAKGSLAEFVGERVVGTIADRTNDRHSQDHLPAWRLQQRQIHDRARPSEQYR